MRRQPQVSCSARHCTVARVREAALESWGAPRLAWPARHWVVGMRGSGLACSPPGAARLSPLLCVSVERRPQEAAPRKAATDRSAQRQTSKEGGLSPTGDPGPGRVAGHFGSTLKSAFAVAARSDSREVMAVVLKVAVFPFLIERAGLWWLRGARGSGGRPKICAVPPRRRLPGVHLERWTCFGNVDIPRPRHPLIPAAVGGGHKGAAIRACTPNSLEAISAWHCRPGLVIFLLAGPFPAIPPASLFILGT